MRTIFFFLLLIAVTSPVPTMAQANCDFTLTGSVKDSDGSELPGATIWVESLKRGTTSAANGSFALRGLCEGEYTLHIKFLGYEDQSLVVKIPSQDELKVSMQINAS